MIQSTQLKSHRAVHLDILRILAMGAVIMIHVTSPLLKNHTTCGIPYWLCIFFNTASRFAVPCFIMITGALYLREEKEYTIRQMLVKAGKNILLLYFWSFIYVLISICNSETFHLTVSLKKLIIGHYHLWYLFMLSGIYLTIPILKKLTNKNNTQIVGWFLLLAFVFQFTRPLLQFGGTFADNIPIKYLDKFHMEFFGCYPTYLLLGWYLNNVDFNANQEKAVYIAGIAGLLLSFTGMVIFNDQSGTAEMIFCSTESIHTLAYSAAIFLFMKKQFGHKSSEKTYVFILSQISFGVYLLHPFFLDILYRSAAFSSMILQVFVHWIAAFLLSCVTSYIIFKIPILRKIMIS